MSKHRRARSSGVSFWQLLAWTGVGVSAYHGYKRNDSVAWAIAWGLSGGYFPFITVPVALAQGYGERRVESSEPPAK